MTAIASSLPQAIQITNKESSFNEVLERNPNLSNLKKRIFNPLEFKVLSHGRGRSFAPLVTFSAFLAKIYDYALRKFSPIDLTKIEDNNTFKTEKNNLMASLAKNWARGKSSYVIDNHLSKEDTKGENFLYTEKFSLLEQSTSQLSTKARSKEWEDLGITMGDIDKAQEIFLEDDNHTQIQGESPQVKAVHAYLVDLLEDRLKLEVMPSIYDELLPAFNHNPIKVLEFLHTLTDHTVNHHVEKMNETVSERHPTYEYTPDDTSLTQFTIELHENQKHKVTLTKKLNVVKTDSREKVSGASLELGMIFRKNVQGLCKRDRFAGEEEAAPSPSPSTTTPYRPSI